ncbi:hypothetical protein WJ968_09445 [Achromobacter xylosoxidans]
MSEHHQFLFPRDLHLPPPDWRALEARLLEGGYVLEPRGQSIPQRALINLSFGLASLHEGSYQYDEHMRTPGDVIALYARAGYLPPDIPIRHNDTWKKPWRCWPAMASRWAICMPTTRAAIGIARNTAWDRRPGNI